ncbi:hypothetical protein BDV12DRAFT_177242 [Aspergillus spectabilis]
MRVLGLETTFAQDLIRLERSQYEAAVTSSRLQLVLVPPQHMASALAAFSSRIHIYYPILPLDFSDEFFRVLSGPFHPSCRSCLVLLVAAIGCIAQDPESESPYFEAALTSLPLVVAECSLVSVQCLLFLAIYYCSLLKPCQAHDYCLMASFKIQNIFKLGLQDVDPSSLKLTHRVYWAMLLHESELSVQLDVAKSDIWALDDHIPLPNCRQTWQFELAPVSTTYAQLSPASVHSTSSTRPDQAQSFFLAEIAMCRMLHRCNSAVALNPAGQPAYAPGIALELQRQLDEWYDYLAENIQFTKDVDHFPTGQTGPLSNFLRVQYYCCRVSIYWPAVYQALQDGESSGQLVEHCQRFLDSYVQLLPSIILAVHDCLIHRWTLFLSVFITTLAASKAASIPSLSKKSLDQVYQCLSSLGRTEWTILENSESLQRLRYTLNQRLARYNYDLNSIEDDRLPIAE